MIFLLNKKQLWPVSKIWWRVQQQILAMSSFDNQENLVFQRFIILYFGLGFEMQLRKVYDRFEVTAKGANSYKLLVFEESGELSTDNTWYNDICDLFSLMSQKMERNLREFCELPKKWFITWSQDLDYWCF